MTLVEIIPPAIKVSIVPLVFALGLKTQPDDLTFLIKRPSLLVRSLLSINLIMPVVAAAIVLAFGLGPPIGLMIVAMALAPLPPILPNKNDKAGGDAAYAVSLTVTSALSRSSRSRCRWRWSAGSWDCRFTSSCCRWSSCC